MPGGGCMVAFGMNAIAPDSESQAESVEMVVKRHLGMDAHERVLTDAMAGDAGRFARQDYVALKADPPVFEYRPQSWGPGGRAAYPAGW